MRTLSLYEREEIAESLWRIFGLMAERIAISYTDDSIQVKLALNETVELDGDDTITHIIAAITGFHEYKEKALRLKRQAESQT